MRLCVLRPPGYFELKGDFDNLDAYRSPISLQENCCRCLVDLTMTKVYSIPECRLPADTFKFVERYAEAKGEDQRSLILRDMYLRFYNKRVLVFDLNRIRDEVFFKVIDMNSIVHLNLCASYIQPARYYVDIISQARNLRYLDLSDCGLRGNRECQDTCLIAIAEHCPKIEHLRMKNLRFSPYACNRAFGMTYGEPSDAKRSFSRLKVLKCEYLPGNVSNNECIRCMEHILNNCPNLEMWDQLSIDVLVQIYYGDYTNAMNFQPLKLKMLSKDQHCRFPADKMELCRELKVFCPSLTRLHFDVQFLKNLPSKLSKGDLSSNVTELIISYDNKYYGKVVGSGEILLDVLEACGKNLKILRLISMNEARCNPILHLCPHLQELILHGDMGTEFFDGVNASTPAFPSLVLFDLDFRSPVKLNDHHLIKAVTIFPNLTTMRWHVPIVSDENVLVELFSNNEEKFLNLKRIHIDMNISLDIVLYLLSHLDRYRHLKFIDVWSHFSHDIHEETQTNKVLREEKEKMIKSYIEMRHLQGLLCVQVNGSYY